ncbi:MAG: DUF3298 domain-containing protein [Bacteroidetes bacterium]|nr:MAG: DUF3298 domain-containing protein [Bacteroidota bacterium]
MEKQTELCIKIRYMKFSVGYLLLAICCLISCQQASSPAASAAPSIASEMVTVTRSEGNCEAEPSDCATVNISYLRFSGGAPGAADSVNAYCRKQILEFQRSVLPEGNSSLGIEEAADAFIENYRSFRAESPDASGGWNFDLEASTLYETASVLSVYVGTSTYSGGAHPNSFVSYACFNATSGQQLTLTDLVSDPEKLKALAEKKFREMNQLSSDANLDNEGFFFEGGIFSLNNNFALTPEGLSFYYNPYEIAPYAMGPTVLTLTYEDLGSLLTYKR